MKRESKFPRKQIPSKVIWYFPPIPRFKTLFRSIECAENLTWHASERIDDGLSADGVNPHGDMSSKYSCWPIVMVIYNLPPWLCLKRKYMMLSMLISKPKQPGNDIGTYLAPLIEDLKLLWENGVECYDAYREEVFNLRSVLLWIINDFPAYGNLSGCCVKGYKAYPICGDNTNSIRLRHGTLLDIPAKSKDGLNARRDLVDLKLRPELAPISSEKKILIPPTCYNLIKEEKRCVLKALSKIKAPEVVAINGCRYRTKSSEKDRSIQNNGVSLVAKTMQNSGGVRINELGYVLVDLNRVRHKSDSFILVSQAKQVFYVEDPSDVRWSVVLTPPRRDFEDRYNDDELGETILQCEGIPNDMSDVDLNNDLDDMISTYIRSDCEGTWIPT
ncbi:transposase [Cucumis melo var. makuwa]|uniref:Transposase n=1 Tax=Cucumis melo var. makuwa TaxID=1194695 RepID=A0A5A7TDH5_CUCMM|nr:transposase [Cucumis melo var. makuwa]TYK15241.1 transposase [Cucumis melo var. makuwa]